MPIKKGKSTVDSKRKEAISSPETKKKGSKSKTTLRKQGSKEATLVVAPREGTLDNPGDVLGLNASMLKNMAVTEKTLNKEEVGKLDLN